MAPAATAEGADTLTLTVTWKAEQDGLALADEIWLSIQMFVDGLIDAFKKSVPKRLRRLGVPLIHGSVSARQWPPPSMP